MTMWHEDRLLVDGELVAAENGATYETISPATEAVLGFDTQTQIFSSSLSLRDQLVLGSTEEQTARPRGERLRGCYRSRRAQRRSEVPRIKWMAHQSVSSSIANRRFSCPRIAPPRPEPERLARRAENKTDGHYQRPDRWIAREIWPKKNQQSQRSGKRYKTSIQP